MPRPVLEESASWSKAGIGLIERLFKGSCTDFKQIFLRRNYNSKTAEVFLLDTLYPASNKKPLELLF